MKIHSISSFKINRASKQEVEINSYLKIGFTNFKKFEEFPIIELKPLTFFVGPNNAGKSTSVKALDIVIQNLKIYLSVDFQFSKDGLGTWQEFLNRNASENKISFSISIGDYDFNLNLIEHAKKIGQQTSPAEIKSFSLLNRVNGAGIEMYFELARCLFKLNSVNSIHESNTINETKIFLHQLNEQISRFGSIRNSEYLKLIDQRNKIAHDIEKYSNSNTKEDKRQWVELFFGKNDFTNDSVELTDLIEKIQQDIYLQIYINTQEISDLEKRETDLDENELEKKIEDLNVRNQQLQQILEDKRLKDFFSDFQLRMDAQEIVYLNANLSKQQPLFLIKDSENQLSQAIHAFAQLREFSSNSTDYSLNLSEEFLLRWFRAFNIGSHFEIKPVNGIAYTFHFSQESNEETFDSPLSEMGMGTIQLTTLLLRLATLIRKSEKENKLYLVLVEEPELSLHPNFQSMLCDLFYEVHSQFPKIRFVIETHSEYIIRKSQFIGLDNNLFEDPSKNPFAVIYFDKKNGPFEMNYTIDGRFDRDFGTGFFDVSPKLMKEIIKKSL